MVIALASCVANFENRWIFTSRTVCQLKNACIKFNALIHNFDVIARTQRKTHDPSPLAMSYISGTKSTHYVIFHTIVRSFYSSFTFVFFFSLFFFLFFFFFLWFFYFFFFFFFLLGETTYETSFRTIWPLYTYYEHTEGSPVLATVWLRIDYRIEFQPDGSKRWHTFYVFIISVLCPIL